MNARDYYAANKERINAQSRAYYAANRERLKATRRAYCAANKDRVRAWSKTNYAAKKEQLNAQSRAYRAANKAKCKAVNKAWHIRNAERVKAHNKAKRALPKFKAASRLYRAATKPHATAMARVRNYGLIPTAFDALLVSQVGLCAICQDPLVADRLNVDHDHSTGKVRGLLCIRCNRGLGNFCDNVKSMRRAADYVEQHRFVLKEAQS